MGGWVGGWVGWVGWGGGQALLDGFARHRERRATSSGGHGGAGSEAAEGGGGPGPCGPARRRWSTGAHERAALRGRGRGWGGGVHIANGWGATEGTCLVCASCSRLFNERLASFGTQSAARPSESLCTRPLM